MYSWGKGENGQLGIGSIFNTHTPQLISPSPSMEEDEKDKSIDEGFKFVDIGAGLNFSCALSRAGQIWIWGKGKSSQQSTRSSASYHDQLVPKTIPIPSSLSLYETDNVEGKEEVVEMRMSLFHILAKTSFPFFFLLHHFLPFFLSFFLRL